MNATQSHFVTVCPNCSTGLKVRRAYLDHPVVCKQCSVQFLGKEVEGPSTMVFGEGEAGARTPPPQPDRIIATCPNCQATLRVRRLYIGNNVICKECERTFLVLPPEEAGSNPAVDGLRRAEHDRLHVAHRELEAEHGRLAGLLEQRNLDLDAARAEQDRLGLDREKAVVEAERLRIEGSRLSSEIEGLRRAFEQAEHAHREELSRLEDQLRQARDQAQDAERLRGQCDQLRSEGAQLRAECDQLRSGVENLHRALEEDERTDREELARVEAELIGLAGRNQELQDQYESARQLCTEYQDRNQDLLGELARLRSESTARTNAERSHGTERTELPREALAGLWEIADYADASASQPKGSAASVLEVQAIRIEVEDLKRRLTDSERLQREMAGILAGMGIRVRQA
jgi:predicted  nucleic acid-binding Zn-ribbon protein